MNLDERKLRILAAIVEIYISTGEPIGSKMLSDMLDFKVSPATIRNDMASLFEMGLLEQPHTSAGRVPSHLGYRVYIDRLMCCKPLNKEERDEIDALFNVMDPDPDRLLEDAAQALADYTNCATISTTITSNNVYVRSIQVITAGARTVILVVIASNGVVRDKVCRVGFTITSEILDFINRFANGRLAGKSLNEISQWYINSIAVTLGEYSRLFTPLLAAIFELCKEIHDGQFYTSGTTNLLSYDELSQIAHELLTLLERRNEMLLLIDEKQSGTNVTIGKENNLMELFGSSVLITKYKIGYGNFGAIGIIGPVRLDYAKIIPHLEYFSETLGKLLSETYEQE